MQAICFKHKLAHSLIWQFNMPFPHHDGSNYIRSCAKMQASPGVTYQDIVNEVNAKSDGHLETVTIVVHWYMVSLSIKGFLSIAKNFYHYEDEDANFERRKINLAKELIASRDYELNGGDNNKHHDYSVYWPKD